MTEINKNYEDALEFYDLYPSGRNPKLSRNPKGYDRARDRKHKRLYEYEEENEVETYDEEETRLF